MKSADTIKTTEDLTKAKQNAEFDVRKIQLEASEAERQKAGQTVLNSIKNEGIDQTWKKIADGSFLSLTHVLTHIFP